MYLALVQFTDGLLSLEKIFNDAGYSSAKYFYNRAAQKVQHQKYGQKNQISLKSNKERN